jgi:putative transposase
VNPLAEAWVQRVKRECLDHFVVFGEKHLQTIMSQWLEYYHFRRPHQGLGNVPISGASPPGESEDAFRPEEIVCHESLGGLLKHWERKAA